MYKFYFLAVSSLLAIGACAPKTNVTKGGDVSSVNKIPVEQHSDIIEFVNPFIGTGGHGHTYPGASAPFGMMQLSPDTRFDGWDGCSGYHFSDNIIYGFSHTHLSGTGVSDYGDLLVVPQVSEVKENPLYTDKEGFGAKFSHQNEKAEPGYYKVLLDNGIDVELTTSQRAGMHKYVFPKDAKSKTILLDLDHRDELLKAKMMVEDKNTIRGYRISKAWAEEQHFYFFLKSNLEFDIIEAKDKDRNILILSFPESTEEVLLKVGMSAVDLDGAKVNLYDAIDHWDFEKVKSDTQDAWRTELNKIQIETSNKTDKTIFYTSLYHSFLNPNIFNDADGRYRGWDKKIHTLEKGQNQYTVFSLWDTYRGTHPLFTLVQQERTKDFIQSFMRMYEQGGDLPVWELAGNETECMIGYHSVSVIADAYVKGIDKFDAQKVIQMMVATSNHDDFGKTPYRKNNFIGTADEPESVSKTLEYAYDDFCISQMIRAFIDKNGETAEINEDLYQEYSLRSLNFINVFDPSTNFMRARRSGLWFAPFKPEEVNFNYTEANSWQYSLYAPHAVGVLNNLISKSLSLEIWLDNLFSTESDLSGRHQVDITGLIGQYAHGNEPSHHMAYLYNYTGSDYKTSEYIDRIYREMYQNAPDGLSGNEDCGQMSSWYVLSSLGFYPIAPGNPSYDVGRPLFDKATIHFENGKQLILNYKNNSTSNKYIKSIQIDGTRIKRNYLTHEELTAGGEITFEMSVTPSLNKDKWSHAPTISTIDNNFTPAPYFRETSRVFENEIVLHLEHPLNQGQYEIYYSLNNVSPAKDKLQKFNAGDNIPIKNTTTIRATVYNKTTGEYGPYIENVFVKKEKGISLKLETEFANQYASSGADALIDGVSGSTEYRTGDWQGYFGKNIIGTVSFEKPRTIHEVSMTFLQDTKSWIFVPTRVEYIITFENGNSKTFSVDANKQSIEQMKDKKIEEFRLTELAKSGKIKSISFNAINFGPCPAWHLGKGNPTWLFADEIKIK